VNFCSNIEVSKSLQKRRNHSKSEGEAMKKLKEIYLHNSIIQFVVSYIMVLVIPLIICSIGAQVAFGAVGQSLKISILSMLNHSKSMIDTDLKLMQSLALQVARNNEILRLAEFDEYWEPDYYLAADTAIKELAYILKFKGVNLLSNVNIMYEDSHYILAQNTLYATEFYHKNLTGDTDLSFEEWKNSYFKNAVEGPFYRSHNGKIQLVQPIQKSGESGLKGVAVCEINMDRLYQFFDDMNDGGAGSFFILDQLKNVLYSVNGDDSDLDFVSLMSQGKEGFSSIGDKIVIYTTSRLEDWIYIMEIPREYAMSSLVELKRIEYILILLAGSIGIGLVFYTSIKKGKPINDIFNIYIPDKEITRDFTNLGGAVSKMVSQNRKLIEEMENEKPLLQNAFLLKLVRGEFVNARELSLLAEKIGYRSDYKEYVVLAFRVFGNNDFYYTDSQTVEEVRIISRLIQGHIRNAAGEEVWFYEVDYLTTIAILPYNPTESRIENVVRVVEQKVSDEYKVYPSWGVSNPCRELLELWRSCEEAKTALDYCLNEGKLNISYFNEVTSVSKDFYYPDLYEERLVNSVRSGDTAHIKVLLDISRKENFEIRKIPRTMFLKLNARFVNTILSNMNSVNTNQRVDSLNAYAIQYHDEKIDSYYNLLQQVFESVSTELQQFKKSKRNRLILNIQQYIDKNYMDSNVGLSMLATEFNVSEGYISTLFKEQLGINFADYVEKLRIGEACILLKQRNIAISNIAERVGYNSIQSFRRAFKKVKGVSPRELRNN